MDAHSVANEVYHTLITTISTIVLFASKTKKNCHLFNEDEKGHVEFIKVEKLHQMLLNFIPFCSPGIHNLIVSLKPRLGNLGSIDCILKLKHYLVMTILRTIFFLVNTLGKRFICSKCSFMTIVVCELRS